MTPSKTQLVIDALLKRGYCEVTRAADSGYRCFAISPNHARRVSGRKEDRLNRLWLSLGCHLRHGVSWDMGKSLPRSLIQGLQREGQDLWLKRERDAKREAAPRVFTLADLLDD